MGKKVLYAVKFIAAGFMACILLSVFIIFYNFTGIHIENPSNATDYIWEPNQFMTTMDEGYAWIQVDGNGYNNAYPAKGNADQVDILLMGSSHMEAVNVMPDKNTGYLLNKQLPGLYTYNIGISGHTIYHCVNNIRDAVQEFAPKDYVIMETSGIELSVDSMNAVLSGSYARIPSYDTGMVYWMQKLIPASKRIFNKLDEWKDAENTDTNNKADSPSMEAGYQAVLSEFLAKAVKPVRENGSKLLIFYHPETKIDENGDMIEATDTGYLQMFQEACEAQDILFVDMSDDFNALYEGQHILAHGFSNSAVGAGHLNQAGHQAIANRLEAEIKSIQS